MSKPAEMSQSSLEEYFKFKKRPNNGVPTNGKKTKSIRSRKKTAEISSVKSRRSVAAIDLDINDLEEAISPTTPLKRLAPDLPSDPGSDKKDRKRIAAQNDRRTPSPRKKVLKSPASAVVRRSRMTSRSPRRALYLEGVDGGKVSNTIENLNLARMRIFPRNNFCLEKIYASEETADFDRLENIAYNMDEFQIVYDAGGVVIPRDRPAEHLFNVIAEVFSDRLNAGYFNDEELDQVFTFLTRSEKAQMLFARMIKRKHQWQRSSSIDYSQIDADLKPHFDELEAMGFYTSDTSNVDLETLLAILKADEVREICQQFKVPWKNNKAIAIEKILKMNSTKSLFPGIESPSERIRKSVVKSLGHCVCLRDEIVSLVERIMILFTPLFEPSVTLSEIFMGLEDMRKGSLTYVETPLKNYPRFSNRNHLVRYVEWKNKWQLVEGLVKTNPENWETLKSIGREAHSRFMHLLKKNSNRNVAAIPRHVIRYSEEYVCAKLVTICLEVFKREESLVPEAIEMLTNLIEQRSYLQSKRGAWYEELALIETKHRKNLEAAAAATIAGLTLDDLTENIKVDLVKRARGLLRRRSGLTGDTRSRLADLVEEQPATKPPRVVAIDANSVKGTQAGRKSTWCIDMGDGDRGYTSVEGRASHYYKEMGYPRSWHCEGSLPVTLFALLMWEEIYSVPVPAAYVSPYQKAPLDIYTSQFYANRKEFIDKKIELIEAMRPEKLGAMVWGSFERWRNYASLIPEHLPIDGEDLEDVVKCMGTAVVTGICKRLATNFIGCRAGFPDLVVWNPTELKCKIVEVKGPGDSLSAKQTLWLKYLDELGADTELCEVKSKPFLTL